MPKPLKNVLDALLPERRASLDRRFNGIRHERTTLVRGVSEAAKAMMRVFSGVAVHGGSN